MTKKEATPVTASTEKVAPPVDGFTAVTPKAVSGYWALQIVATGKPADGAPTPLNFEPIGKSLGHAISQNLILFGGMEVTHEGGSPSWRIKVTQPNGDDQFADEGDWIVLCETSLKLYRGADGKRALPVYTDYFPAIR